MSDWTCIDIEPQPDGFVGGDGACESVSIRFQHATEPAIVTVYLYVIDLTERGYSEDDLDGQPFDVEEMVEFMVLEDREDPGTEVWSDYAYDRPSQVFFETEADAEDYRDRIAATWLDMGASHYIGWDGKTV